MPKVTKPAKPTKAVEAPTPEPPKPQIGLAPANDERKPVYRIFECVVHLEQAIKHLEGVGITPPILQETSEARRKMIADLRQQLADYKAYWANLR